MGDKAEVAKVILHVGVKSRFNGRLFNRFIGEFVIEILGKFWVGLISDVSAMTKVTEREEDQLTIIGTMGGCTLRSSMSFHLIRLNHLCA